MDFRPQSLVIENMTEAIIYTALNNKHLQNISCVHVYTAVITLCHHQSSTTSELWSTTDCSVNDGGFILAGFVSIDPALKGV